MQTAIPAPNKSGHAAVNGVNYYYAVYGTVILIYGDSDMFRPEHIVKFYQLLRGGLRDAGWQGEHMSQNRRRSAVPERPRPRQKLGRAGKRKINLTPHLLQRDLEERAVAAGSACGGRSIEIAIAALDQVCPRIGAVAAASGKGVQNGFGPARRELEDGA